MTAPLPDAATSVGLTSAEAAARLAADGPNQLPPPPRVSPFRQLVAQLFHFFALLLWVAGLLAVVGGMPQLGLAIFVVILVNGLFAFVQEYRAERAAERLRDLLPRRAHVIRDGLLAEIDAEDLVRGDVVLLEAGDRISADLRCAVAHGLSIDTSQLTGESVPTTVDQNEQVFAGSYVVEGDGRCIVEETGQATRLAAIAVMTQGAVRPDTPLTKELHRLVRTIAVISVACGVGFFLISLLLGMPLSDGFIFGVGVTVALVPEGLLPTVTLSLAIGAQRMAAQHALVRRLDAVETLGSTTFICTDKTGTLTENRMNVVEVWTPRGSVRVEGAGYEPAGEVDVDSEEARRAAARLALVARRCSNGHAQLVDGAWISQGDPMEAAIDALAHRLGADADADSLATPDVHRFAFDPRRRRQSVVTAGRVLVKGAPDSVLARCTSGVDGADRTAEELAARGLRVLAVATRPIDGDTPATADVAERDLELLGLLGLQDPPRPHVAAALEQCRRAGIKVAMITGDSPATAAAIGRQTGLARGDLRVHVGADLPDDEQVLGALLDRDGVIVARVSPEDKLRIARALRARGHVLAMTGDGVNDGPALREADIGVAMGASGTDVAREAADLVLLDDDFATVVMAIRQGRATFANARRFLTYHLTDNVAELTPFALWALSGSRIPLALGVLQILALDIGTDTLPAAALGAEEPRAHVLDLPPVSGRLLDRSVAWRAFGLMGPMEALFEMSAFFSVMLANGWRPGDSFPGGTVLAQASGAAFLTVVVGQMANALACRSTSRPPWRLGWFSNPLLVVGITLELAFAALLLTLPALVNLLDGRLPPAIGWLPVLAVFPAVLALDAVVKHHRPA